MRILHARLRTRDAHPVWCVCRHPCSTCQKKLPRRAHTRKMLPLASLSTPLHSSQRCFLHLYLCNHEVPCCFNDCGLLLSWCTGERAPYNEPALPGVQRRSQQQKPCAEQSKSVSVYILTFGNDLGRFDFSRLAIHPLRQTCGDLLRSPLASPPLGFFKTLVGMHLASTLCYPLIFALA